MKQIAEKKKWLFNALLASVLLTGMTNCKKKELESTNQMPQRVNLSNSKESASESRQWNPSRHLFGVGHNSSSQALLYSLSAPPGLVPTLIAPFLVGVTPVTYVHGIACTGSTSSDKMIICTAAISNYPNSLLIYPFGGPYNTPTIVPCANISDIEFNEYDGNLYGIATKNKIVRINTTSGALTTNLSPTLPTGFQLRGLCNYNGLLSYSVNDNTASPDNFYSYNPSSPSPTPVLFSTDWGANNEGGMQYCDGTGWVLVTSSSTKKTVLGGPPYTASAFSSMTGGPYLFSDITSD